MNYREAETRVYLRLDGISPELLADSIPSETLKRARVVIADRMVAATEEAVEATVFGTRLRGVRLNLPAGARPRHVRGAPWPSYIARVKQSREERLEDIERRRDSVLAEVNSALPLYEPERWGR